MIAGLPRSRSRGHAPPPEPGCRSRLARGTAAVESEAMTSSESLIRKLTRQRISPLDLIDKDSVVEKVLALILTGPRRAAHDSPFFEELLERFEAFPTAPVRTVVFGGGSGLSSITGGDSRTPEWADHPFTGLKDLFPDLTVGVCTTDDGGSTGLILKQLELIALGDFRKVCLSMVKPDILGRRYSVKAEEGGQLVAVFQRVLNHRFEHGTPDEEDRRIIRDPLALFPTSELPDPVGKAGGYLRQLGAFLVDHPVLGTLPLKGNCLGNLLLVAAVYRRSGPGSRKPSASMIFKGLQEFADHLGAPGSFLFPATTTPGQLRFLYGNGVVVYGQNKAMVSRRGFPVERVFTDYLRARPHVDARLLRAIQQADLILFAPGSVFSSLIPVLQIESITGAIRENAHAVKVLAGNFWVQEGETDITRRGPGARYHVSDMIEAYHRNVPGGVAQVFNQVLMADLQQLPGHVLRNYALEGKLPIYLDRDRVRRMGFESIEAPVLSREKLVREHVLQHDPARFARAMKAILFMRPFLRKPRARQARVERVLAGRPGRRRASPAGYLRLVDRKLDALRFRPARLQAALRELLWANRDVLPEHLDQFEGIQVVPEKQWMRSTAWDKVLGYFDPADGFLKIHEQLVNGDRERLFEDILIGMGESLLGRYFQGKELAPLVIDGAPAGKVYSFRLASKKDRGSFFKDGELRTWLELAGMKPSGKDPDVYRFVVNGDEGFMPPGLLLGTLYAWYLNNRYGGLTDYEMSLIRWRVSDLIPHQTLCMMTRKRQIAFLRSVVFHHEGSEIEEILEVARQAARQDP